jgi:Kef-type K+ transport system membrane component KefB
MDTLYSGLELIYFIIGACLFAFMFLSVADYFKGEIGRKAKDKEASQRFVDAINKGVQP